MMVEWLGGKWDPSRVAEMVLKVVGKMVLQMVYWSVAMMAAK